MLRYVLVYLMNTVDNDNGKSMLTLPLNFEKTLCFVKHDLQKQSLINWYKHAVDELSFKKKYFWKKTCFLKYSLLCIMSLFLWLYWLYKYVKVIKQCSSRSLKFTCIANRGCVFVLASARLCSSLTMYLYSQHTHHFIKQCCCFLLPPPKQRVKREQHPVLRTAAACV